MGLDIADFRPLVLCKSHNRVLCFFHAQSLRFFQTMIIAQHVSQFHGLPISQRFPLQFPGKIGYAVAPAIFVMQKINDFLHGVTGADDLRLNFVSDT